FLVDEAKLVSEDVFKEFAFEWMGISTRLNNDKYNDRTSLCKIKMPTADLARETLRKKRLMMDLLNSKQVWITEYLSKAALVKRKEKGRTAQLEKELDSCKRAIQSQK